MGKFKPRHRARRARVWDSTPDLPPRYAAAAPVLDAPFDPPDEDDDIFTGRPAEDDSRMREAPAPIALLEDEPPFDMPDESEDFGATPLQRVETPVLAEAPTPVSEPPLQSFGEPANDALEIEQPAPPIAIHVSWDRPEMGAVLAAFAADRRMSRAKISVQRGGLDAAAVRFAAHPAPDLLILDTTLRRAEMLAGLERLAHVIEAGAKVIVLGAVNDIALLRELAARGVSEYFVSPRDPDALVRTVCRLYAATDKSRVIAVVGARGGVGASTVAQNLAWCIAERQRVGATLADLDLCFGATAFNFAPESEHSIADALDGGENIDDLLDRASTRVGERLHVLTAPASLGRAFERDAGAYAAVIDRLRRTSPFVVLDVPHAWSAWVKQVLATADDVVIVAAPDLASLRNAKNMLEVLQSARPGQHAPLVVLSMTGVPKRPEFTAKDIIEVLGAAPHATLAFDPALFCMAEIKAHMIAQAAPSSKAALVFDDLATTLTGRPCIARTKIAPSLPGGSDAYLLTQAAPDDAADAYRLLQAQRAAEAEVAKAARGGRPPRPSVWGRVVGGAACLAMMALIGGGAWRLHHGGIAFTSEAAAARPTSELGEIAALRRSAEAGYAPAQYRLAKLYERGEGVDADLVAARRWTERAAAGGHSRAMHDLGVFFAHGEGAPADDAAAFRWFRQAAEFGVADSQFNLGALYEEGRGVTANASEALFWFSVAAAQGDAEAAARAIALSANMTAQDSAHTRARASAFRPRAAEAET